MARLALSTFGPFEVTLAGEPVTAFVSNKVRALLAYLAVEADRPHRRDTLAALLWPDWPDRSARTNLRNALANLRKSIVDGEAHPPHLLATRETIQFNADSDHWLDVAAFRALVEAEHSGSDRLEEAVALYRGPFLEGFSIGDSAAYDDWSLLVREGLERQVLEALDRLAALYEERGEIERARDHARRQVALAPWQESAHRHLMRLLALGGERSAALAQYEACRRSLAQELGVEPGAETLRLYERIRADELGPTRIEPARRLEQDTESPLSKPIHEQAAPREEETLGALGQPRHNLPAQTTPFIGRERQLAEVRALLARPEVRLLTLTGPGGTGKTRLALQVAAGLVEDYRDGVCWVPLAPLRDPALVVPTIAATLGVRESEGTSLMQALQFALHDRERLLVIDNCEQVITDGTVGAAQAVSELLAAAPGLKVLATSRAPLHVYAEHEYPVPPMEVPTPRTLPSLERLGQAEAMQLFVQRARRVRPGFALDEGNAPAVAELCARLDGLPLAVELAAARVKLFSPQAMLDHMVGAHGKARVGANGRSPRDSRLQFLTGGPRDLPARQRTLRATIEWSYDLLDADEQALFARLSVFADGATLEAIEAVCLDSSPVVRPSSLDLLESLIDQSLLQISRSTPPRFTMLETVREYAAEQLEESGEAGDIHRRHARFYLGLAEEAESKFFGPESVAWLDRLESEHDNLRAALAWSVEHEIEVGLRLAGALGEFWGRRGYAGEGRVWLATALAQEMEQGLDRVADRAKALHWAGFLASSVYDFATAPSLLEESLALRRALNNRHGIAHTLCILSWTFFWMDERIRAESLMEQSVHLFRQLDERSGLSMALSFHASYAIRYERDHERARQRATEALSLAQSLGDALHAAVATSALVRAAFMRGDYATMQVLAEENLALVRESKHRILLPATLGHLGDVAYVKGRHERAEDYYGQAFRTSQALGAALYAWLARRRMGLAVLRQGRVEEARAHMREALVQHREIGHIGAMSRGVAEWAGLALFCGRPERAARLLGAAETAWEANDLPMSMLTQIIFEDNVARVRAQLDEDGFRAAWAEGRAMTLAQAVDYALEQGPDL